MNEITKDKLARCKTRNPQRSDIMLVCHVDNKSNKCICKGWSKISGHLTSYEFDKCDLTEVHIADDTRLRMLFDYYSHHNLTKQHSNERAPIYSNLE